MGTQRTPCVTNDLSWSVAPLSLPAHTACKIQTVKKQETVNGKMSLVLSGFP